MKLHLLDRASVKNKSFTVSMNCYPHFLKIWHHHQELELVVIKKSTGTRFIGDSIEKFEEGEVVLIGSNLPHMWLNDDVYFQGGTDLVAEAIAVHFTSSFLGEDWLNTPEMKSIRNLFELASQGVKFEQLPSNILDDIEVLLLLDGFERAHKFLKILNELAIHPTYNLLTSKGFISSFEKADNESLDKIYEFIFKNFNTPIQSKDVAAVAHMNASAFSRFFKRVHRKTFTRYLNEIRIGYACKLLIEKRHGSSVSNICFESGFNNISNFNRQFKSIMNMSPSEYMKFHA